MPKIVFPVMHSGVSEDKKFVPILTISCKDTATVKFERQGVTFDGFTKEQIRDAAAILRADEKVRNLVNCVKRTYRDYEADVAQALDDAANSM